MGEMERETARRLWVRYDDVVGGRGVRRKIGESVLRAFDRGEGRSLSAPPLVTTGTLHCRKCVGVSLIHGRLVRTGNGWNDAVRTGHLRIDHRHRVVEAARAAADDHILKVDGVVGVRARTWPGVGLRWVEPRGIPDEGVLADVWLKRFLRHAEAHAVARQCH